MKKKTFVKMLKIIPDHRNILEYFGVHSIQNLEKLFPN